MMPSKPEKEDAWLQELVGEWSFSVELPPSKEEAPGKPEGTEKVRAIGNFWIICESQRQMPDRNFVEMMMTLGYDSKEKRFGDRRSAR